MNERLKWLEHKGVRILYVDHTGVDEEQFIQNLEDLTNEILQQEPGTLTTLNNLTDAVLTGRVMEKYKELAERTEGYSLGAAAVGVTGFKKAMATLVKRDLYLADSIDDAKDWLAEQAKR